MTLRGSLPDGWCVLPFRDIAASVTERVDDPPSSGLEHYVGLEHLDSETLTIRRWGSPSDVESTKLRFYPGDVIYARRRAYQKKLGVARWDGICSAHALVLRAVPDVCVPEFLPYFLQSDQFHQRALDISVGSLSPTINWKTLAKQEFVLPSLSLQQEIAEALSLTNVESEAVERSLRALGRLSDARGASVFSTLEGGRLVPLEELSSIPPQNGVTVPKDQRTGPVQMINMGALFREEVVVPGCSDATVTLTALQLQRFAVESGDLLFARRSIVLEGAGRCVMVSDVDQPVVFESSIIRVRIDPDVANPEFVLRYLHSPPGRAATSRIVRKGAVAGIAGSDLRRLPVPLPPLEKQVEAIEPWSELERLRDALNLQRQNGLELRRALREWLLDGRSDV